ncbi:MAG: ATPase [Anaerolineae bacterium]|nr:ATPase [Anaerolineae bacterium]
MTLVLIAFVVAILPLIPGIYFLAKSHQSPEHFTRKLVVGINSFNLAVALAVIGLGVIMFASPGIVVAAGLSQEVVSDPYASIAAAIAVGLGSAGAGIAVSSTGAAAIGAIAEKPEVFGRALIFVGLSEGVAIYGLIIAFIILQ